MALMDFIKKQFIDVIHWTEDGDDVLAYRYPMQDFEIQYGAQLTVRDSQMAVFVNEGQVADVFGPGMYKLTTQTLPLLTNLKNWDKLFESPFKSEVYFFSTRLRLDRKWGTPNPITIRDKDFGMVRMRAFGIYSYKLKDPGLFYKEISGTREEYGVDDLDGQLRNLTIAAMTDLFGESGVPFIDMAANQMEFGKAMKEKLVPVFERYGLELDAFAVQNVSLPEELQKVLDTKIGMNMIGDMGRYTQYQTANAIPLAAQNEGVAIGSSGSIAPLVTQSAGTQIYFAARTDGLVALDMRDPANPAAAKMAGINAAVMLDSTAVPATGFFSSLDGIVINPTPITSGGATKVYALLYSYRSKIVASVNLTDGVLAETASLPITKTASFSGASAFIAGGIADGKRGKIWLATGDGLLGVDPSDLAAPTVLIPQPSGTRINENLGGDPAKDIVYSPDYVSNGLVVFNLAEARAYVMATADWRSATGNWNAGGENDGVTVTVPQAGLNQLTAARLGWLVPGLLEEKVTALLKTLPKEFRRELSPIPESAKDLAARLPFGAGELTEALARLLDQEKGMRVGPSDFDVARLHQVAAPAGHGRGAFQRVLVAALGAAQHAHQAPHGVVVHRRVLARPPDEADHRETLQRVGVQQVLRIAVGTRRGKGVGQPVVGLQQRRQQLSPIGQQHALVVGARGQAGHRDGEAAQRRQRIRL